MSDTPTVKISVIVPVYNVEQYISRCILSLLNQTIDSIEILVVDDKGSDNSIALIEDIRRTHVRGSVIKMLSLKKNSGAAAARNFGLQHAKGEYIGFVDSDDWCEPDMFELLYTQAKKIDADWSYCNAFKDEGKNTSVLPNPTVSSLHVSNELRDLMLSKFVAYFWTGIYKRSFLTEKQITFPSYRFSEDSYFLFRVVAEVNNIVASDKPLYHYIVRDGSVTNTYSSIKEEQRLSVFSDLLAYWKDTNFYENHKDAIDFLYFKKAFLSAVFTYILFEGSTKKGIHERVRTFLSAFPAFSENKYLKQQFSFRIIFLLLRDSPLLSRFAIRIYAKRKKGMF
jgi:glycosyltransferase involved in cell wall biosynthesis